jgi:ribonuclease P protein component
MLTRSHRFHGYNSLKSVYRRGKNIRAGSISLRYERRSTPKPYRVAVVVSRKVNKSAVVRNRIRRRIYEAVRRHEQNIPVGLDLVFTVYEDNIARAEAVKIDELIGSALEKIA